MYRIDIWTYKRAIIDLSLSLSLSLLFLLSQEFSSLYYFDVCLTINFGPTGVCKFNEFNIIKTYEY